MWRPAFQLCGKEIWMTMLHFWCGWVKWWVTHLSQHRDVAFNPLSAGRVACGSGVVTSIEGEETARSAVKNLGEAYHRVFLLKRIQRIFLIFGCWVRGFHGGVCEDYILPRCVAIFLYGGSMFPETSVVIYRAPQHIVWMTFFRLWLCLSLFQLTK